MKLLDENIRHHFNKYNFGALQDVMKNKNITVEKSETDDLADSINKSRYNKKIELTLSFFYSKGSQK